MDGTPMMLRAPLRLLSIFSGRDMVASTHRVGGPTRMVSCGSSSCAPIILTWFFGNGWSALQLVHVRVRHKWMHGHSHRGKPSGICGCIYMGT